MTKPGYICEVALPTFRRPENVLKRIEEVRRHRDDLAALCISDNSPELSVEIKQIASRESFIRYSSNSANIGGGANFLRAIELAQGDFIWLRGDDDPITDEQVSVARNEMARGPRLIILGPNQRQILRGKGLREFSEHFSEVSAMGWLSMIIFPRDTAHAALPWGYWGIHTGWANVSLVLGLFRIFPELEFSVVPFELQRGDFREVGRKEGGRWAFFTTCICKFPLTAGVIADEKIRNLYLRRWRQTQGFFLCKTLARQLAGLGGPNEEITFEILRPLLAWDDIKSSFIAVILRAMALFPPPFWQMLMAGWSLTRNKEQLEALDLEWLIEHSSFADRLRAVRKMGYQQTAGQFL